MKKLLLLSTVVLTLLSSQTFAQSAITLTDANVPLPLGGENFYSLSTTGLVAPATGSNVAWDYHAVVPTGSSPYLFSQNTNAQFPAGSVHDSANGDQLVTGYYILYNQYYQKSQGTVVSPGVEFPKQGYTVQPLTGNAADSIWVADQSVVYPVAQTYLPLPVTNGTTWANPTVKRTLNMQLTLTAYGVIKAPFQKVSMISRTDTVVGWGTITLPSAGGGSQSAPALLVQREDVRIDSFYLGGQPAPTALLTAFGLTQAGVTKSYRRLVHIAGQMLPIMILTFSDNMYSTVTAAGLNESATQDVATKSIAGQASVYPNPIVGNELHVTLGNDVRGMVRIELTDLLGRLVTSKQISGSGNQLATFAIPSGTSNGEYFVRVIGESGNLLQFAKVQIAR